MTTTPRRTNGHDGARTPDLSAHGPARTRKAKIQETLAARDALAAALTRAGIQLPAMDVRTPWQDMIDGDYDCAAGPAARYALVHLGVCSAPVAFALAAVIIRGVGR